MTWLTEAIIDFFSAIAQFVFDLIQWLLSFLVRIVDVGFEWLLALVPDSIELYVESLQPLLAQAEGMLEIVSYFIPIWGYTSAILAVASIVWFIRAVRWFLGLIPTLSLS